MSNPESELQAETLKNIAVTLKGIQASIDRLTASVEEVAESIEKAHEPEGDLGIHLVGALKELVSALHKRSQQERIPRPAETDQQARNRRDIHRHERGQSGHNALAPDGEGQAEASEMTDVHRQPRKNSPGVNEVREAPSPQRKQSRNRGNGKGGRAKPETNTTNR
jgi:hypothetical protein